MLVVGFPAGPWGTNCWIIAPSAGAECVIVDPGKDASSGIADAVREHNLKPIAVMLSHGHLDHMWSVAPVCKGYETPAWIHPADRRLLTDPFSGVSGETRQMMSSMTGGTAEWVEPDEVRELADLSQVEVAGLKFRALHAPGHTPGSTAFTLEGAGEVPPIMLSGDLLFQGSIGRTDLPGGDWGQMETSLRRCVLPQPDDMVVLPGHGGTTTIGDERKHNPFLRDLGDEIELAFPTKGL